MNKRVLQLLGKFLQRLFFIIERDDDGNFDVLGTILARLLRRSALLSRRPGRLRFAQRGGQSGRFNEWNSFG